MFKKIIIVIMLLIPVSVNGLSPMYLPDCFVRGEILSISFQEAEEQSQPNLPALSYPKRFILDVFVNEVDLIGEWEHDFDSCDELYPVNEVTEIYVAVEDVPDEDIIGEGNIIEGTVLNFFGPYFENISIHQKEAEETQKDSSTRVALVAVGSILAMFIIVFFLTRKGKENA